MFLLHRYTGINYYAVVYVLTTLSHFLLFTFLGIVGYSNKEILLHWTNQSKLFMDVGLVNNMPKYQLIHHKFHELNASWTDTSKITGESGCSVSHQPPIVIKRFHFNHRTMNTKLMSFTVFFSETFKSRLQITFELRRYPLAVFFQSYFPALAMVLLAGLGMWIDQKSAPARVSLGKKSLSSKLEKCHYNDR